MIGKSSKSLKTPLWKDMILLAVEICCKQVYYRLPWVAALALRLNLRPVSAVRPARQVADRDEFLQYLQQIGIKEGALVMVHTSTSGVIFSDGTNPKNSSTDVISTARYLVQTLMDLVGQSGTLVLPTSEGYQAVDSEAADVDIGGQTTYNPATTPCRIGLANELFRRRKGVKRSLYPHNMVSAFGPLADELLENNLNANKPLPHGISSPYYRLCKKNGLIVSIGAPLGQCITLVHAAEDARDEAWPIKDFFEDREYVIQLEDRDMNVVVRRQRPEYTMYCRCRKKNIRDLLGAGIIHEGMVGSLRVDWAHSGEVFDYLMKMNEHRPYPFYCTWLVGKKRLQTT